MSIRIRPSVAALHPDQDTQGHRFWFGIQDAMLDNPDFQITPERGIKFVRFLMDRVPIFVGLYPHPNGYRGYTMDAVKGIDLLDQQYLISGAGALMCESKAEFQKIRGKLKVSA